MERGRSPGPSFRFEFQSHFGLILTIPTFCTTTLTISIPFWSDFNFVRQIAEQLVKKFQSHFGLILTKQLDKGDLT